MSDVGSRLWEDFGMQTGGRRVYKDFEIGSFAGGGEHVVSTAADDSHADTSQKGDA